MKSSILILCFRPNKAKKIAHMLEPYDLEPVVASDTRDALKHLKNRPFDMIIVEAHLGNDVSGLEFLAQAYRRIPQMRRIILKTLPITMSMEDLINTVAPSAIFNTTINPQKVYELAQRKTEIETARPTESDELGGTKRPKPSEREKLKTITSLSIAMTHMIENPDLSLPILPEIALKIRSVMADANADFEVITKLVEQEQGLSARILQVANSPIYAGLERIRNIQQAIGRLGMRETYNIIMAVVAQNLFSSPVAGLEKALRDLWLHSLATAYSNEAIARKLSIRNSNDFFMMGLLHDIGKLLILHLIEEGRKTGAWKEHHITEDIVMSVMDMRHNDLGSRLLEVWHYPAIFRDVVRLHNDDEGIEGRNEAVVVTYFSNLLTRKMGYSLVPYERDLLSRRDLERALNMGTSMQQHFESSLRETVENIKSSCFIVG